MRPSRRGSIRAVIATAADQMVLFKFFATMQAATIGHQMKMYVAYWDDRMALTAATSFSPQGGRPYMKSIVAARSSILAR